MTAGELREDKIELKTTTGGEEVEFGAKLIDAGFRSDTEPGRGFIQCLRFRMRQAEKAHFKHVKVFKGTGTVPELLKAWGQAVVGTAVSRPGE